ncbi:hypothetical protein PCPL58_p1070 (plasmid) [Pseudomonas cerasi]|uniref:Uncharacterized protein n=1 Tax=Pseudomonas cerasi TaxID=1583341 RepID=A0A193SID9_9PSED|nr:hypothetical protein PCPL58_p1070 [Pseudomonas cerasi]SOS30289.1 hypothetical protein PL963_P300011 [Pseudomonas cerasi]
MPTKKKSANATARELPSIPQELIEQFVKGPMSAEAIQDASMAFMHRNFKMPMHQADAMEGGVMPS